MTQPLGEDYFTRYGAHTPGLKKKDYSRNWRIYTFSVPEILRTYRGRFGQAPKTFLDLGAADGSLMKKALQRGLKARGIENSAYILARIRDPKIRALIRNGDAVLVTCGADVIETLIGTRPEASILPRSQRPTTARDVASGAARA